MPRSLVKTAPWVFCLLAFCTAFSAFGVALLSTGARNWLFWGLVMQLLVFAIALLLAASTRIEDRGDVIRVVAGFRATTVAKSDTGKVSWAADSGALIRSGRIRKGPQCA